jgi:hypothetical protein
MLSTSESPMLDSLFGLQVSSDYTSNRVRPKNLLEEAINTPNGGLVRRCFRILNAKSTGLTITLADITEEEFRGAGTDRGSAAGHPHRDVLDSTLGTACRLRPDRSC